MAKVTRKDCSGCHDDFYNHTRCGANESSGKPQCWSLATATKVKAYDIPTNMPPPYKGMPLVSRPNCYKAKGYCRVKPEALRADGYWRF